ncbi:MAG: zf-HC2 domain-containing protein [Planctomycetes bacterium]|nr:zf-HC2 domain-containing protein [Planctomycetota bacterium]
MTENDQKNADPCAWTLDQLGALLDGELGAQDRAALEEHLSACPRCRSAESTWRQDWELLGRLPGIPSAEPSRFLEAVHARIRRLRRWTRIYPIAGAAAALAAALLVFVSLRSPGPRDLAPEDQEIVHNLPVLEDFQKAVGSDLSAGEEELFSILNELNLGGSSEEANDGFMDWRDYLDLLLEENSEG